MVKAISQEDFESRWDSVFSHNVFVYGILMCGEQEAVLHGYKKIVGLGGFYTVVPDEGSHVSGELLRVDSATLNRFDVIEGYPDYYDREKLLVEINGQYEDAWVYAQ